MPTTYASAITAIRERLDEELPRHWKNDMLRRWIFEGCRDVARKIEVLQDTATIDCTAGTQEYTLPADMVRVYRTTWVNDNDTSQTALEYKDFNEADAVWWTQQTTAQGTPQIWTAWGIPGSATMVLYPTPAVDGTLTLQYYRLPAAWTADTDTLEIPEGWQDLVYAFVEYRALRQDRDPRWQEAKQEFDELLGVMHDQTRRFTDQQGRTIQGEYPAINGWLYEFD